MPAPVPAPASTRLLMLENDFIHANETGMRLRRSEAAPATMQAHLMLLAAILGEMDSIKQAKG